MNNISLKSIKYESIKAIFTSITEAEKISRADISEKTELSLVTVGKIADALLERDIICQVKEIRTQAGRRAGLLSINESKFALILDLTSCEFKTAVLDLRLRLMDKMSYTYRQNLSFEENIGVYLAEVRATVGRKYDLDNCFGIGVAVPGPYNEDTDTVSSMRIPCLAKLSVKATIKKYFKNIPVIVDSQINAAARSNVANVPGYEEKNIVYWYISDSFVCGAYIVEGNLILGKGRHACDFGGTIDESGMTLEDKLDKCADFDEYLNCLSRAVGNVLKILSPHTLIVEYDSRFACDDILGAIRQKLTENSHISEEDLPDMMRACCRFRNSHRGLTMHLREMWLENVVFGE